ncbi:hypothetical protein RUM44_000646 [Polyplax serrata]|uniref:Uncharacterized protein n=1 Tax=Polyplax serrata TaxID=468196 RepID=A0ABR1B5Z6_POLSC
MVTQSAWKSRKLDEKDRFGTLFFSDISKIVVGLRRKQINQVTTRKIPTDEGPREGCQKGPTGPGWKIPRGAQPHFSNLPKEKDKLLFLVGVMKETRQPSGNPYKGGRKPERVENEKKGEGE